MTRRQEEIRIVRETEEKTAEAMKSLERIVHCVCVGPEYETLKNAYYRLQKARSYLWDYFRGLKQLPVSESWKSEKSA